MDYKEQLEQLKTELANAETPEQLSEAEFKIKKLKMQKELTDMESAADEKSEVSSDDDKEDILFSSSSAAADFLLGYSVSGPTTWKDKNGKTLKEIESVQ